MSVVLIGLVLAAFVAVAQVKKRLVRPDDPTSTGFTLADLRALHREGKMTDAEFEKAKQVIVVASAKATRPSPPRVTDTTRSEKGADRPTT
jgi:hypothetical protein